MFLLILVTVFSLKIAVDLFMQFVNQGATSGAKFEGFKKIYQHFTNCSLKWALSDLIFYSFVYSVQSF